jgi:hypothetical protein
MAGCIEPLADVGKRQAAHFLERPHGAEIGLRELLRLAGGNGRRNTNIR